MPTTNADKIGAWTIRVLLVIGAIVLTCLDKPEGANMCGLLCIMSFFFLDV